MAKKQNPTRKNNWVGSVGKGKAYWDGMERAIIEESSSRNSPVKHNANLRRDVMLMAVQEMRKGTHEDCQAAVSAFLVSAAMITIEQYHYEADGPTVSYFAEALRTHREHQIKSYQDVITKLRQRTRGDV